MAECWTLKIISGPTKGKIFPLKPARTSLGRHDGDIALAEEIHAEITYDKVADALFFRDFAAASAVKINGKPLKPRQAICDGDRITIGHTEAVFEGPSLIEELPDDEPEAKLERPPEPAAKKKAKRKPQAEEALVLEQISARELEQEDRAVAASETCQERLDMARELSAQANIKIELSSNALNVPEVPASAGKAHYSQAGVLKRKSGSGFDLFSSFLPSLKPSFGKVMLVVSLCGGAALVSHVARYGGMPVTKYAVVNEGLNAALDKANQLKSLALNRTPANGAPGTPAVEAAPLAPTAVPIAPGTVPESPAVVAAQPPAAELPADHSVAGGVQDSLMRQCEADASFCFTTALAFYNDKTFEMAVSFFDKGCTGRHAISCVKLAGMYNRGDGVAKSDEKAVEYYSRGCELGQGVGCASVGYAYSKGTGVVASAAKAAEAFTKACKLDVPEACTEAGLAFKNGVGVERSPATAGSLLGKACQLHQSAACEQMKDIQFK